MDLALNNQQWLICHKTKSNNKEIIQIKINERKGFLSFGGAKTTEIIKRRDQKLLRKGYPRYASKLNIY